VSRLWVDANVILRFLTRDPLDMAECSARLMAKAEIGEVSLIRTSSPSMSGHCARERLFAPLFLLGTAGSRGAGPLAAAH